MADGYPDTSGYFGSSAHHCHSIKSRRVLVGRAMANGVVIELVEIVRRFRFLKSTLLIGRFLHRPNFP